MEGTFGDQEDTKRGKWLLRVLMGGSKVSACVALMSEAGGSECLRLCFVEAWSGFELFVALHRAVLGHGSNWLSLLRSLQRESLGAGRGPGGQLISLPHVPAATLPLPSMWRCSRSCSACSAVFSPSCSATVRSSVLRPPQTTTTM